MNALQNSSPCTVFVSLLRENSVLEVFLYRKALKCTKKICNPMFYIKKPHLLSFLSQIFELNDIFLPPTARSTKSVHYLHSNSSNQQYCVPALEVPSLHFQ